MNQEREKDLQSELDSVRIKLKEVSLQNHKFMHHLRCVVKEIEQLEDLLKYGIPMHPDHLQEFRITSTTTARSEPPNE